MVAAMVWVNAGAGLHQPTCSLIKRGVSGNGAGDGNRPFLRERNGTLEERPQGEGQGGSSSTHVKSLVERSIKMERVMGIEPT